MALHYFDTSGLAKRYLSERGSELVRTVIATEDIIISDLTSVEIASVFARNVREAKLTPGQADRLFAAFDRHKGNYQSVPLTLSILEESTTLLLSAPPTIALRTLDALHVASAQRAFAEARRYGFQTGNFITADRNLLAAAAWAGFAVLNPEDFP